MTDLYIEARLQAIKDIASTSCSDIKDADNIVGFCDEIYSAIPKLDKIVEELELHSFELGTDTIPVHYVRLNEAIEIIKQGGVSDDICEWKQDNMCETVYRVCGGFSTTAYQTDFEFCPYCGKKIKVIQNDN